MAAAQPPAAALDEATTGADVRFGGRNIGEGINQTSRVPRTVPDARLRQLARRVHALGERPLYELLRELFAGRDLIERFEAFVRLDPALVRALGGDHLDGPFVIDGGRS